MLTYDSESLNPRYTDNVGRVLRNEGMTIAQEFENVRNFIGGHTHQIYETRKLKIDYDPGLSLADNDFRFFNDPDGIRNLCLGVVKELGQRFAFELLDQLGTDGEPWWQNVIRRNPADATEYIVHGTDFENIPATVPEVRSALLITVTPTSYKFEVVNQSGQVMRSVLEDYSE